MSSSSSSFPVIGTHSGTFHCDEALACWMLLRTEKYANATIVRSRDTSILDKCDCLVDVGGSYDPTKERFDHHQRSFVDTFSENHDIRLSSAGLVYKHYGSQVVRKLLSDAIESTPPLIDLSSAMIESIKQTASDEQCIKQLYAKVYDTFIKTIDAIDNGVEQFPVPDPSNDQKESWLSAEQHQKLLDQVIHQPRYRIDTDLSSQVGQLNPLWMEDNSDQHRDVRFQDAMELAGKTFANHVYRIAASYFGARKLVSNMIAHNLKNPVHPQIMVFESSCPWKEHLFDAEKNIPLEKPVLYVIFKSGSWRVQAVPIHTKSFVCRLALPQAWRGLRDQQLSTLSGIDGCVFVHASGFIGGNQTKQGAIDMALKSLQQQQQQQ